jgi:hypothetical protein
MEGVNGELTSNWFTQALFFLLLHPHRSNFGIKKAASLRTLVSAQLGSKIKRESEN